MGVFFIQIPQSIEAMLTSPVDEQQLLLQISHGSRQAFRQLYEQTSPLLFAVALRLLRKRELAEEILQEVYVTLWHVAGQYHTERGSVRTWLATMTRNRCIDHLRKVTPLSLSTPLEDDDIVSYDDPLARLIDHSHHMQLSICIGELTLEQRQCISLAFFEGLTHQQVAAQLAVPLGSAKTWIRRGLDALKRCMGGGRDA